MPNPEETTQETTGTEEVDYKALYEQAKADADKWKAQSRKNESRAKTNAGAARDLEEANAQLESLSARIAAIEDENSTLKAEAERTALVAKVASATGVPEAIVSTLAANDEQTLTDAATAIAGLMPHGAPNAPEAGKFPRDAPQEKTKAQLFADAINNG